MIKYYDTLAAYEADVKSDYESQVSLIGADNSIKFDGRNVIVGIQSAMTGSIAVLDGNSALHFVSVETFSSASFMSNYQIVGVVRIGIDHPSFRGKIVVINKEFPSKKLSNIYSYRLTGYTLDGTARTGTIGAYGASDNWAARTNYVVSYNASTETALVEQLNTYFRANEPFVTQKWKAVLATGGGIDLQVQNFTNWQQASANGSAGFTLTANFCPDWVATDRILKMNGSRAGYGTITNWARALNFFRNDQSNTSYNPSSDVASLKISYPICLPAYLGTSEYQSDHCAFLREHYGEGEEGWLKFMSSFLPVRPSQYGSNGDKEKYGDARRNTYLLASKTYADLDGISQPLSPAATYVANIGYNHELLKKGQWVMPDSDLLFDVVSGLEYSTTNNRDADVINRALKAIGSSALSNGSFVWSCSRYNANNGWCASGGSGGAYNGNLYYSYLAVPLVLLEVPQSAA